MEDMNLTNSNVNSENSVATSNVLPESPVVGFQAVDAEGHVLGFVSKADLVNEAKQALYADLAVMAQNRPTTLEISPIADVSTMSATDEYEDQLQIVSDAPFLRGLDALGNPIRISKQDVASVVGELIGIDNDWIRARGYILAGQDLNDLIIPGVYTYYVELGAILNGPTIERMVLLVFKSSMHISQIAVSVADNKFKFRGSTNEGKTWCDWMSL